MLRRAAIATRRLRHCGSHGSSSHDSASDNSNGHSDGANGNASSSSTTTSTSRAGACRTTTRARRTSTSGPLRQRSRREQRQRDGANRFRKFGHDNTPFRKLPNDIRSKINPCTAYSTGMASVDYKPIVPYKWLK